MFIKKQHQVNADVDIIQDLEIQQKVKSVGPSCPLKDIWTKPVDHALVCLRTLGILPVVISARA